MLSVKRVINGVNANPFQLSKFFLCEINVIFIIIFNSTQLSVLQPASCASGQMTVNENGVQLTYCFEWSAARP